MNRQKRLKQVFLYAALTIFCHVNLVDNLYSQYPADVSLKEAFKHDFLIGTALSTRQIDGRNKAESQLITANFDAVTPENLMKAHALQPRWGQFNFEQADEFVAFAASNQMKVNGHTLIWHSQLPGFMQHMENADSVRQYFVGHIRTVASRYDGKVDSWDVVNEALNEDGTLRNSIFLRALGEDYIVEAFRLAQEAAPNTKLYYNDYNIEQPSKRAGAIALIKKIQAAGVRIDGVGIQGHWHVGRVPMEYIEQSIQEFAALGLEVMFTELDLSVLPNPLRGNSAELSQTEQYNKRLNPYTDGLPDSVAEAQAEDYGKLFGLFLKYREDVSRVTFWGVHDGGSWLNNWPVRGRTNYPLVFDRKLMPKSAFHRIIAAKHDQE